MASNAPAEKASATPSSHVMEGHIRAIVRHETSLISDLGGLRYRPGLVAMREPLAIIQSLEPVESGRQLGARLVTD